MSTVNSPDFLKTMYSATRALGDKSVNSDAFFEPEGFEEMSFLIRQFPWPAIGVGGAIEMPGPLGIGMWQPEQVKVHKSGQLVMDETANGMVLAFMTKLVAAGGVFNATVYEGHPNAFYRALKLRDCIFVPDDTERSWDNRTQVTNFSGNLSYHFFGEVTPGPLAAGGAPA